MKKYKVCDHTIQRLQMSKLHYRCACIIKFIGNRMIFLLVIGVRISNKDLRRPLRKSYSGVVRRNLKHQSLFTLSIKVEMA